MTEPNPGPTEPTEPKQMTADDARNELKSIAEWLNDYNQRTGQQVAMGQRAAFLQGFLAAQPAPAPNRAARRAPKPKAK